MLQFLYRILLPTGLAASCVLVLLLALRPALRLVPARQRRLAYVCAAALFLLPLPAILSGVGGVLWAGEAPASATLAQAAPTAPLYAVGEAIGGALEPTAPAPEAAPEVSAPQGQNTQGGVDATGPIVLEEAVEETTEESAAPAGFLYGARSLLQNLAAAPLVPLALLYLLGLAVTAGLFTVRYLLFMRCLRRGSFIPQGVALHQLYSELCDALAIRNPPALRVSENVAAPLLAGLAAPVIVLPAGMQHDPAAATYALRHELTHHRHGDVPLKNLVQAVVALHWFNPLCYLLRRQVNEVCEQACDEAVAEALDGAGRKAYAMALLQCVESRTPYAVAGFAAPARRLKKRLAHLLHPVRHRRGAKPALLASLALLCTVGVLAGCTLQAGTQSAVAAEPDAIDADPTSLATVAAGPEEAPPPADEGAEESENGGAGTDDGSYKEVTYITPEDGDMTRLTTYTFYADGYSAHSTLADSQRAVLLAAPPAWRGTDAYTATVAEASTGGAVDLYELDKPAVPLPEQSLALPDAEYGGEDLLLDDIGSEDAVAYVRLTDVYVESEATGSDGEQYGIYLAFTVPYVENMDWLYQNSEFIENCLLDGFERGGWEELAIGTYETELTASLDDYIATLQTTNGTGLAAEGGFINPVPGYDHLSRGMTKGADGYTHRGIDLVADAGEPIVAAAAGEVSDAGWHYSYGYYVVVDHGGGLSSMYTHCQSVSVVAGQQVNQGDVVALVGSTGYSSSNHLHLEVHLDGEIQDPLDYIVLEAE